MCLVSLEIPGPVVSGGIGRTMLGLAHLLVRAGHEVTVLFTGDRIVHHDESHWRSHFRRQGLHFVHHPGRPHATHRHLADRCLASYRTCQWLANTPFEILYFHENMGLAYYVLAAKQAGSAFMNTLVCVGTHAPTRHALEANGMAAAQTSLLSIEAMEKACIQWADVVISPSRHMLRWLVERDWPLPSRCFVQPNPLPLATRDFHGHAAPVDELVFFGRLEPGKGVDILCDALDRLDDDVRDRIAVTFLGKNMWMSGQRTTDYIADRAAAWSFPCTVIDGADSDTALAYLSKPGRVAVMPSRLENYPCAVQECLQLGIPFIAANVGGVPELVDAIDRGRVLFEPNPGALADVIRRIVDAGAAPARPVLDLAQNEAEWSRWFSEAALTKTGGVASGEAAPSFQVIVFGEPDAPGAPEPRASITSLDHPAVTGVFDVARDGGDRTRIAALLAGTAADHIVLVHRHCQLDAASFEAFAQSIRGTGDVYACVEVAVDGEPLAGSSFPVHGAGALGLTCPFFGSRCLVIRTDVLAEIESSSDAFDLSPWYLSCVAYLGGYRLLPLVAPTIRVDQPCEAGDAAAYWRRLDLYRRHLPAALDGLALYAPWPLEDAGHSS